MILTLAAVGSANSLPGPATLEIRETFAGQSVTLVHRIVQRRRAVAGYVALAKTEEDLFPSNIEEDFETLSMD